MVNYIRNMGTTKHKDNFFEALAYWLIITLYAGYRGMEWIQEKDPINHGCRKYDHQVRHTNNMIYYFVDKDGKTIGNPLTADPSTIAASGDTVCFQKNPSLHGTKIEFLSTLEDAAFCPTLAKIRILKRHQRLGMNIYIKYKGSKIGTNFLKAGVEKKPNETG